MGGEFGGDFGDGFWEGGEDRVFLGRGGGEDKEGALGGVVEVEERGDEFVEGEAGGKDYKAAGG